MSFKKVSPDSPEEKPKVLFIKFTDLYIKKQEWLEDKLIEGYTVYLTGRSGRPLKISLTELG